MSAEPAIIYRWDGESFTPIGPRNQAAADNQFVIGEHYALVQEHKRSAASHNHFFAAVAEAWANLPDEHKQGLTSEDDLRKRALIMTNYADTRQWVVPTNAEASRLAAAISCVGGYAIVTVDGIIVTRHTAQSQSLKAMGAQRFQESKQAVLDYLETLLGVEPGALEANAGQHA